MKRRNGENVAAAKARAAAEARLEAAKQMTGLVERLARHVAELPDDEFARRVIEAFGPRA